ncbi:hypothetical protein CRV01_05480 [Arcobacter sp. CECT 8983]|uniref:hypothetical protein n=1 Tax=Arcobacter sp. CECT 8983 TaxID=2044508 RepID=UPI00100A910D|nr:hypothetical protein [Arcobacter sp. CECT 8983]RXJ90605.1 hypothetical protein CRV01_05480 [Arcobacter sp. CECT 8983]
MFEILILILLTIILRIIPKFIKNRINGDTWYHFAMAESIRNNNFSIPKRIKGYLLPNLYDYPYFYHYLLSFLSLKQRIKYERIYSAVLDALFVILAYFSFIYLYAKIGIDSSLAFFSALLLSISPTLLKVSMGPRAFDATPRVLGELLVFGFFIAMFFFYQEQSYLAYGIGVFFAALSLITSKFSAQVIFIFSLIIGSILNSLVIVLAPIAVFLIAIIISKERYMTILIGQYQHLKRFAKITKNEVEFISSINRFEQYKLFFKYLVSFQIKKAYLVFHSKLSYLNFIIKDIEVFLVLILMISFNIDTSNNSLSFIYAWFAAGFMSFILTGSHAFKFIGEADRYLEYAIFPTFVFLTIYLQNNILWLFLPFTLLYIYNVFIYSFTSKYKLEDLFKATEFIKNNYRREEYRLLGLVETNSFYYGEILTGLKCMAASEFSTENCGEELWKKYYQPIMPIRTNDFEWMYQEFGVNIILAYQPYIDEIKKTYNHEYKFDGYKEVYNKNDFVVYEKI